MEIHAHLIIAPSLETADISEELKHEGVSVRHLKRAGLGIADARWLIKESYERPLSGGTHQFVISAQSITIEAQNALLKLFEEPPQDAVFYLIVPHPSVLVPTLRSRLIMSGNIASSDADEVSSEFLRSSISEQLQTIADLAKKEPEALGRLAKQIGLQTQLPLSGDAKHSLLQTLSYVYNRGASRKMLLEELALSLQANNK